MPKKASQDSIRKPLKELRKMVVFKTSDAVAAGISQPTLSRLAAEGEVVRLEHGFYHHQADDVDPQILEHIIQKNRRATTPHRS